MRLDSDTLIELYPDPDGRRRFLRRAMEILRADRTALQDALASDACATAAELAHRLQGTAAFLTGDPERSAAILAALDQAVRQRRLHDTHALQTRALDYLAELESAIARCVSPDEPA
jgi:hypothetical protein